MVAALQQPSALDGLRPYQLDAVRGISRAWMVDNHRTTLLVLPVGTGKTRTFSTVLKLRAEAGWREGRHRRALVVAHTGELLEQAKASIERFGLSVELEQAENYARARSDFEQLSDVVVASLQTLHKDRLKQWPRDAFDTIVIDEAHRSVSRSYRQILRHFGVLDDYDAVIPMEEGGTRLLGVTATPDRADGIALGNIYQDVAFTYPVLTAIQQGWLTRVVEEKINCADLDLSSARPVKGDISNHDIEAAMTSEVLYQIAGPISILAGTTPTIVFAATVEQAHALGRVLAGFTSPERVAVIDGKTPTIIRRELIAAFKSNRIQFMINVGVLTEGFDYPAVGCIAIARPTMSRSRMVQMMGRGLRLSPATGKKYALILQFTGKFGAHRMMDAVDALAGKPIPDDVRAEVTRLTSQGFDVEEALTKAEERAREMEEKRIADARRDRVRFEVPKFTVETFDPFGVLGPMKQKGGPPALEAQRAKLEAWGVKVPEDLSIGAASTMIKRMVSRKKKGLCTFKQAQQLAKRGLSPDLTFAEAREALDSIASNGWRVSPEIKARFGKGGR